MPISSFPRSRPTCARTPPRRRHLLRTEEIRPSTHSNPAKRRKTGTDASQSSQRSKEIEGIDLTGVDDDRALSKVLEQQRIATVKAQQEQASKPVKLSTIQCIICMENMTNITATSCGTFMPTSVFINSNELI